MLELFCLLILSLLLLGLGNGSKYVLKINNVVDLNDKTELKKKLNQIKFE